MKKTMKRTSYGFMIVDRESYESGVVLAIHYLPLDEKPTPEAGKKYLDSMLKDKEFAKQLKETESTPMVVPVIGIVNDLFDLSRMAQEQMMALKQNSSGVTKSNILSLDDVKTNGEEQYPTNLPTGAEMIIRGMQQNGNQVII